MDYRYKLIVSYDGSNYQGFQAQQNTNQTIEYYLTKAISEITKVDTKIYGSGRTDSKVHAIGQVVHFDSSIKFSESNLKKAINSFLPNDIYIKEVSLVCDEFHSRFSPHKKTYMYVVSLNEHNPLEINYKWFYPYKLTNINKLDECINLFIGHHNFKAFTKDKKEQVPMDYYIRTIDSITYEIINNEIRFYFTSKGFMHKQIRMMVAMILEVVRGKLTVEELRAYIDNDKTKANKVAPGCGLYLMEVKY